MLTPRQKPFCSQGFAIAIVCALPKELSAIRALFDTTYPSHPHDSHDLNSYVLGQVGQHQVVAACLPSGEYGTNSAAVVVSHLTRTFRHVKFCLLVGIGAGAPSRKNDIRLGDVVVSHPVDQLPGVVQYDFGKAGDKGVFIRTGVLQRPPTYLMTAISVLRSEPEGPQSPLRPFLDQLAERHAAYSYPGKRSDVLFTAQAAHNPQDDTCANCNGPRSPRPCRQNPQNPTVHYGLIASGNQVVKSAEIRDRLSESYDILCIEMEAAGIMNSIPSLVIRGICDYADSHKNKEWQEYACGTAAAYAKYLLSFVNPLSDEPLAMNPDPKGTSDCFAEQVEREVLETPGTQQDETQSAVNHYPIVMRPTKDPEQRLRENKTFARRLPSWDEWPANAMQLFQALQRWMSFSQSSLLVVDARLPDKKRARDLAYEVTDFLGHAQSYPVLHALSLPTDSGDMESEILKSLIFQQTFQQLQLYPLVSLIQSDPGVDQLYHVLESVLSRSRRVFLVIESSQPQCTERLLRTFHAIIGQPESMIKVLQICYDNHVTRPSPPKHPNGGLFEAMSLPPSMPRVRQRFSGKRQSLWRRLKPTFPADKDGED